MFLEDINFSLWCDFIERDFLDDGFRKLLEDKIINGATSNPAIFKSAFLNSPAYKDEKKQLKGKDPKEIYEELAIYDIQKAADILKPLYEKEDDGFVSIEVDPNLCDDAPGTIKEAKRLYEKIGKDKVMIKIPATKAGFEAMEELIASNICVNATLIFSPKQAKCCLDAFEKGFKRLEETKDKRRPSAVISVFVSRFDRKLNEKLFERNIRSNLLGIINATYIYHMIESRALSKVRCLFASTGVKGDDLSKDYYIRNLLYKNSINTAPLETIEAYIENKNYEPKAPISKAQTEEFFEVLKIQKIDMQEVYDELLQEGINAFKEAFSQILNELS